jgi:ArsR family transcriptional regulator
VAGIIEPRRDGKHNYYSVCTAHFHRLMEQLFSSMSDPSTEEIRFDDFVLTHDR